MSISNRFINTITRVAPYINNVQAQTQSQREVALLHKKAALIALREKRELAAPDVPTVDKIPKIREGSSKGKTGANSKSAFELMKYSMYVAGAAYLYDKTANDFFLSTTSLHDGKGGFTSDDRINNAQKKAQEYYRRYHSSSPADRMLNNRSLNPLRFCGDNRFVSMIDYRAATKVHLMNLVNTKQAHESILKNIKCLKGELVKKEVVEKLNPQKVPKDFDLTKNILYEKKEKYSLTGVPNEETGSTGYTSRSITMPIVEKGLKHFIDAIQSEKAITPKQCMESLEALLREDERLNADTQFTAGQTILIFRKVYANDESWGDAENVVLQYHYARSIVSQEEADKIELSRPFYKEDLVKGILKRNTSIAGPFLHNIYMHMQQKVFKRDPETIKDLMHKDMEDLKNLPVLHFKLDDCGTGFEDCSGLGDSFTALNAASCVNHARMMSGEERLSKDDVVVLIGCLNAVYDNASGIRHSLREIARGCFVGAGFTIEDGDRFYKQVCKSASEEFYGGKNIERRLR